MSTYLVAFQYYSRQVEVLLVRAVSEIAAFNEAKRILDDAGLDRYKHFTDAEIHEIRDLPFHAELPWGEH